MSPRGFSAPATNNPRPGRTFPLSSVTRILIADDHEVVRSGLRLTLEAHEGWEVVAEASDGKEAVAKAVETRPDVAIIDFSLPAMNGIDATRQIHARVPTAEVLIFTMQTGAGGWRGRLSAKIGPHAASDLGGRVARAESPIRKLNVTAAATIRRDL